MYHGIRTTLGQHCTAECRLALRDVCSPPAIGTFVVSTVTRVACFLNGVVVVEEFDRIQSMEELGAPSALTQKNEGQNSSEETLG